jgi:NAD-dependent DNA ligase
MLEDWVNRLGGAFCRDLTEACTHLIAHRVGSEKCKMQQKRKGLILAPAWIKDCFDTKMRVDETNYRLHLFFGYRLCLTGYDPSQRDEIKRLVKQHGGMYTGDLSAECTHLLCAERSGKKYHAAMQWGVAAVRKEWLFDR